MENEMTTLNRQLHGSKTHKAGSDPACPVCKRFKDFSRLIHEIGAQHTCDVAGPLDSTLSFYIVSGKTFIVQWFGKDGVDGFDVYRVLTTSNLVAATFDALRSYASRSIFECDKPIMVESPAGSGKYREMLAPKYAKNGDVMHSDECQMAFGRKDARCPRCIELMPGMAPRARFGGRETQAQRDARQCAEVREHFHSHSHKHLSGGCGPVCTFGEW